MSKVAEFYSGRSILVTGSTGFLGKVLVEKFLRSVPEIDKLYLLIRPQNGLNANERLGNIIKSNVFDRVRSECSESLEKLVAVHGDIVEKNLGLTQLDSEALIRDVSVVFHLAAIVRFDESLKGSVQMNVVGTQRLVSFCRRMKNLVSFVHASTAYANCDRGDIKEMVYPAPVEPQKLIDALEWMTDEMVTDLTPHLIGDRPNGYTLAKALAESLLAAESCTSFPVTIVRPSIIVAACREPFPGWLCNFNGPTGLLAAVAHGLLRTMLASSSARMDLVPVDIVSNFMITAAWYRTTQKCEVVPVVNLCSGELNPISYGQLLNRIDYFYKYPYENLYRVPTMHLTMNSFLWKVSILVNHLMPAYAVDTLARIAGKRPGMVKIFKKLFKALESLEYFSIREWNFETKAVIKVWDQLSPEDQNRFNFDIRQLNWGEFLEQYHIGAKKYIFREDLSNLPKAKKQLNRKCFRLRWWSVVMKAAGWVALVSLLLFVVGVIPSAQLTSSYARE